MTSVIGLLVSSARALPFLMFALLVVGCSSASNDSEAGVDPELVDLNGERIVPANEGTDRVEAASGTGNETEVPEDLAKDLNRLLGWQIDDSEDLQEYVEDELELARRREEEVSRCMNLEGFDYVAVDQSSTAQVVEDPNAPRGTPEFTERYGFGVTTLAFPLSDTGPEAVGYSREWLTTSGPKSEDEDPNSVYFGSLDASTQAAYRETLLGPGGCAELAFDKIRSTQQVLMMDFNEEIEDVWERVEASNGYVILASEVDACMEVGNFTFTGIDDVEASLAGDLIELGVFSPDLRTGEGRQTLRAGEDTSSEGTLEYGSDEWRAALAQIQDQEILLALEFARCIGQAEWQERLTMISEPFFAELVSSNESVWALYDSAD